MKKSSFVALALAAIACTAIPAGAAPMKESVAFTGPALQAKEVTAFRHVAAATVVSVRGRSVLDTVELEASAAAPLVHLVRAHQYELRQIDRQRPDVTPTWRECPSV